MSRGIGAALAVLVSVGAAAPAAAVQTVAVGSTWQAAPPADPERADELRQQAEALFAQPKEWRRAARLLERSADLREAGDPEAYSALLYAGRIRAATGDLRGAKQALERAGRQALDRGALVEAANAFIDAAHAAAALKQGEEARALIDRAALLSRSPLLTAQQRAALWTRLPA